jgi:hypothetical protein
MGTKKAKTLLPLIGLRIVGIRKAAAKELKVLGVEDEHTIAVVLNNGFVLIALRDAEGNGAGHMTYVDKDGKAYDA